MKNQVTKSFPTDPRLDYTEEGDLILTFLNDPKIDAELYNYFLSVSVAEDQETRVYKKELLPMKAIASEVLLVHSRQTVYNHLKYLIDQGYITEEKEYYVIHNKQKITLRIDQELTQYFSDTLKENVIKVYLYLGQRYNYKPGTYEFTIKELCQHLGLNYNVKRNRDKIANSLSVLSRIGLIKYQVIKVDNLTFKMKLLSFSTKRPEQTAPNV